MCGVVEGRLMNLVRLRNCNVAHLITNEMSVNSQLVFKKNTVAEASHIPTNTFHLATYTPHSKSS